MINIDNYMIVDFNIIKRNIKEIIKITNKELMVVIKSNVYGLSVKYMLPFFIRMYHENLIKFLVVNKFNEYLKIKEQIDNIPLLILTSLQENEIVKIKNNVRLSINSLNDCFEIIKNQQIKIKVHLQIDTGMNRTGFRNYNEVIKAINVLKKNRIEIEGIYTHFSSSENEYDYYLFQQKCFLPYLKIYDYQYIHTGSSSSISKPLIGNFVRVGAALYGIVNEVRLHQACKVITHLTDIYYLPEKSKLGYNQEYTSTGEYIGLVDVGYYDGFIPPFFFDSYLKQYKKIGKSCMNHTFISLGKNNPKIKKGSRLIISLSSVKIDNMSNHEILVSYKNLYHIYIKEKSNYDVPSILKGKNASCYQIKKRIRSHKNISA